MMLVSGCLGPIALEQALPDYDETISQLQQQSLLINIARARHGMPPHFTGATSIAATYSYSIDASAAGTLPINPTTTLSLGATVTENPTIELVPLSGEDFARQVLTPLDDYTFSLLVDQRVPFDMIMRLMGKSFRFQHADGSFTRSIRNDPSIPNEYNEFRRIALHLAALNAKFLLWNHPLTFKETETISFSAAPSPSDTLAAVQSGFEYDLIEGKNEYKLSKQVIGNVIMTNYDPMTLIDAERAQLNFLVSSTPSNFVHVNIRPAYGEADYPLVGAIQLRSLHEILIFIARGIEDVPEYDVGVDPRTARVPGESSKSVDWRRNPSQTLTVLESAESPGEGVVAIRYRGSYYSVAQNAWDLAAFSALYLLYQMSTQTTPQRTFPITISK